MNICTNVPIAEHMYKYNLYNDNIYDLPFVFNENRIKVYWYLTSTHTLAQTIICKVY